MPLLKAGTPVGWKAPANQGVIVRATMNEAGNDMQYLVAFHDADGEVHHRHFAEADLIELTDADDLKEMLMPHVAHVVTPAAPPEHVNTELGLHPSSELANPLSEISKSLRAGKGGAA